MGCFLGVDVGATKTHALVADEHGKVIGFGKAGSGNHEVVGYPGLQYALHESVEAALQTAGVTHWQVDGAGFGVAGYDWPSELSETLETIQTLHLDCPIEVVNDSVLGLVAGAAPGWGVGLTVRLPEVSAWCSRSGRPGSWMCRAPLRSVSRTRGLVSTPVTCTPALARVQAVGRPM